MDEQPIVVTMPLLLDGSRTSEVSSQLRAALLRVPVVVADMTQTWACDPCGMNELCDATEAARASGRELRVAVSSASLLRQLARAGVDVRLHIFKSVGAALVGTAAVPD